MSNSLLKKKNFNTTKGTKRWRKNLDSTELEEKIAQTNQIKYAEQQAQEKLKKNEKITFAIDTTGDKKLKIALQKDRFHKKIDESGISENEMKKYRLLAKKIRKQKELDAKKKPSKKSQIIQPTEEEIIENCWAEQKEQEQAQIQQELQQPLIEQKKVRVAHLIIPNSGMSYNPSYKDHQEVIEEAIFLEDEELKEKNLTKALKLRKKKKDLKEYQRMQKIKEELAMNPVQREKKEQRRLAHQAHQIKQFKNEILAEQREYQENLEKIQRQKEIDTEIKEKIGMNFKPERLGSKRYRQKGQDFVLEEELPDNLRTIQPAGNLLRDEYESVFRKGLLEPKNYFKKDRKSKIPAIKFKQRFDPYFQSEWDDVETALDVKN